MKTAIITDWLVHPGGAEKTLEHLLQCFPDADLFSVIDFVDPDQRGFLQNKPVKTTFIQQLPFAKKLYRHYLPLMPIAIEQLDLSNYELILSTSHAVAKGVLTGPDQIHISYIYSPMRYAWDLQHQYLQESGLDKKIRGLFVRYLLHKLRLWDLRSAAGVDHFIASSQFIARRIRKTYRRESTVIYPPVDLSQFSPTKEKEEFYLTASRLVPYKRIDLIVSAFNQMPDKKLIIIGDGPDYQKIQKIAGKNIQLLGYQPDEVLISHLQRAKAFIFAAEEDFGLLPVEAQACGTPVIAYGKGGALETVCGIDSEKPTGLFFHEQTAEAISDAVTLFEKNEVHFDQTDCIENAKRFCSNRFKDEMMRFIEERMKLDRPDRESI